jgi:hypothetical protein
VPPESPMAPRKSERAEWRCVGSSCSMPQQYTADVGILWGFVFF